MKLKIKQMEYAMNMNIVHMSINVKTSRAAHETYETNLVANNEC